MDGAFFVGKSELLSWVNGLLQLNITRVEQMATGAAYCQIMDAVFPGCINLGKVNWMAKYDHEYTQNFKLLQAAFDKNNVQKHIEVEKLIKAKSLDNLEFMQWFKRFVDLNYRGGDYPALERRRGAKTPWDLGERTGPVQAAQTRPQNAQPRNPRPAESSKAPQPKAKPVREARPDESEVARQIAELRLTSDSLEKERDFYFGKLRAIELFCEHYEDQGNPIVMEIQKILFATDEENVAVNDDGTVSITPIEQE
eukprot:CAMPEP_0202948726 /NCGR_PEP_ID=MMETSP1395-20130829/14399_1 /ASSEMBLY_ACC=CAM_ASM_000871 /TAXON_ID=5961 /ORGANISM="Blepharisma japonicum, Strain Stock R1072" /LENGTH=253 /DNA_ID=CAMNT_0049651069 /DNA_START=38 /DNA_END=799 /DNA_ORIENTATION=+